MISPISTRYSRPLLAAAFLSLTAALAIATPADEAMAKLDKDKDQHISLDEFYQTGPPPLHPRMRRVFEGIDQSKTGKLSYQDTIRVINEVKNLYPKLAPE